jgi:hypothetical protein
MTVGRIGERRAPVFAIEGEARIHEDVRRRCIELGHRLLRKKTAGSVMEPAAVIYQFVTASCGPKAPAAL